MSCPHAWRQVRLIGRRNLIQSREETVDVCRLTGGSMTRAVVGLIGRAIGCPVGRMDQLSFNLHVYVKNEVTQRLHHPAYTGEPSNESIGAPRVLVDDRYVDEGCEPYGLLGAQAQHAIEEFDEDLERFLSDPGSFAPYHCSFFEEVAAPMYASWAAYKAGNLTLAQETLDAVEARDWAVAAGEWLQRRLDKRALMRAAI